MTTRKWKYVALAAAGGLVLQMAGCGQMLMESMVSSVLPALVAQLIAGALSNATA